MTSGRLGSRETRPLPWHCSGELDDLHGLTINQAARLEDEAWVRLEKPAQELVASKWFGDVHLTFWGVGSVQPIHGDCPKR